jgi:hypothetical protein
MEKKYDKAILEMVMFLLVIAAIASATTRITDTYVNTTGTMNGSVIWEGNVKLTDKYVELSDNLWNTTAQIWAVVDNSTFRKISEGWRGNTTKEIWAVADNGTFVKLSQNLYNTTSQIWSVVDNNTFTKLSMNLWNTTAQIWSVVDNSTFVKLSQNLWNTTAQIMTIVNSTNINSTNYINTTKGMSIGSTYKLCLNYACSRYIYDNGTATIIQG